MISDVNKILKIIKDIKKYNSNNCIEKTFTQGFCYDFAMILKRNTKNSTIVFDTLSKHYMVKNSERYFDITGELKIDRVYIETYFENDDELSI